MQELVKAQKNIELFFTEEKERTGKAADPINESRRGF